MNDVQSEVDLFNEKANKLLSLPSQELIVTNPYRHLAGSKVPFDYLTKSVGDVFNKRILDVGCGSGWLSVYLAKLNAKFVYGFDVSPRMIEVARKRSEINGVSDRVDFECNRAENIDFEKGFFDLAIGISVLHHIDLKAFTFKLNHVINADGKAFFIEPLGENRLLEFIRNRINRDLLGKRTPDEKPLNMNDIRLLGQMFKLNHREFQLFGGMAKIVGDKLAAYLGLNLIDSALFKLFPSLRKKARFTVLTLAPK